jgi:hypothetical protein
MGFGNASPGLRFLAVCCLLMHATVSSAQAAGGSVSCTDFSPYLRQIESGTGESIENSIPAELQRLHDALPLTMRLKHRLSASAGRAWLAQAERDLITRGPCPEETRRPLDYAVNAANLSATAFLLDRGADPSGLSNDTSLYMRCQESRIDERQREARFSNSKMLAAYELTLRRGGNLNFRDRMGNGVFETCHTQALTRFFLSHGAQVQPYDVDEAIRTSLDGTSVSRDQALARLRLLVERGGQPSDRYRETLGLQDCGGIFQPASCQAVRQVLSMH